MTKIFRISLLSSILFFLTVSSFGAFGSKTKEKEPETSVNPNEVKSIPAVDAATSALEEFKSLSRKEKRDRIKEFKKALKEYKSAKKEADISTNTLLLVLLSILIPPLAVYLHEGTTNNRFWINVLLTVLGYLLFGFAGVIFLGSLPGIIHALIVVLSGT